MKLVGESKQNAPEAALFMSHRDWMEFFKGLVFIAALGIAILYFLEWNGSFSKAAFRQAHRAIWKKPRRSQLVMVCILWIFIVAGVPLLIWFHRAN